MASKNIGILAAGETKTSGDFNVTIPSDAADGQYYLGVYIDNINSISESDEDNNINSAKVFICKENKLSVPYYHQGMTNWCSLFSTSMLLKYFGLNFRPWEIANHAIFKYSMIDGVRASIIPFLDDWDRLCSYIEDVIPAHWSLISNIFITSIYVDEFDDLKNEIMKGINEGSPILIGSRKAEHAFLIVGANLDGVYIHDPSGVMFHESLDWKTNIVNEFHFWDEFKSSITANNEAQGFVRTAYIKDGVKGVTKLINLNALSFINHEGHFLFWGNDIYLEHSTIEFSNTFNGNDYNLKLKFDGSQNYPWGYTYVPVQFHNGKYVESNPDDFYPVDQSNNLGYCSTLADLMNIRLVVSNSKNQNIEGCSIEYSIFESDEMGVIASEPIIESKSENDDFFQNITFNIPGNQWGKYIDSNSNIFLGNLFDQDRNGQVDNESGIYYILFSITHNSEIYDQLGFYFKVASTDYAFFTFENIENEYNLIKDVSNDINITLRNNGTVSEKPSLISCIFDNFSPSGNLYYLNGNEEILLGDFDSDIGSIDISTVPFIEPGNNIDLVLKLNSDDVVNNGVLKLSMQMEKYSGYRLAVTTKINVYEPNIDWLNSPQLGLGSTNGTTIGNENNITRYSCCNGEFTGPEEIYKITLNEAKTIRVEITSGDINLNLFLLGSADENDCLTWGQEYLEYQADAGQYYLVVDGWGGVASNFTLSYELQNKSDYYAPSVWLCYEDGNSLNGSMVCTDLVITETTDRTYYCGLQFDPGYIGLQKGGVGFDKMAIFSIWDPNTAGNQLAEVVWSGTDVVTNRFGNEGEGVQSRWEFNWQEGQNYKTLVKRWDDGVNTFYQGWIYDPQTNFWKCLATIKYPRSIKYLKNIASFLEDFGKTGSNRRAFKLFNGWKHATSGDWIKHQNARYTWNGDHTNRNAIIDN
ncbi:MAG: DUF3472 domain-containing protein, partial [Promethearchaeota archaeon]